MGDLLKYLLALAALGVLLLSALHWRRAILAAMILLIFEGALRKWVLPEAQASLYLAKDVLLMGAYIGFFATRRPLRIPQTRAIVPLLGMTALYGTAQMFNPALPTVTLALIGWKSYFFYVPLIFIVPYLFDSQEQLYRALRRYAFLALPIAALGALQFYSPMDSPINAYVRHDAGASDVVSFGIDEDRPRVAGTFAFISGYTAFLIAAALLLIALIGARVREAGNNAILYFTLGAVLLAMLATGSRSGIYSLFFMAPVYLLFSALSGDVSKPFIIRMVIGILVIATAITYLLPEPVDAFMYRASSADDVASRFVSPLVEPFQILEDVGFLGFGIGAAHQAAAYLVGDAVSWWTNGIQAEAETTRVMLELGLPGFLLVFTLRMVLAALAMRAALTLRLRSLRVLALAIGLLFILQVFGAVIFNPTANLFYWFAAGLLFLLYRFDLEAGARERLRPMQSPSQGRVTRIAQWQGQR